MRLPLRFTLPCVVALFATLASGQSLEFERSRHRNMLRMIKDDVKKNYYDPSFKGIDLEANYTVAVEKMGKAQSFGQMRHDVPAQRRGCGLIAFLTTK